MEDLVAVAVKLDTGEERFFLTWGRIQDPVDGQMLEALVLRHTDKFDLGGQPMLARLCSSVQEAARAPLFYECFFQFCQEKIPYGPGYTAWKEEMRERMDAGQQLAFLGRRR